MPEEQQERLEVDPFMKKIFDNQVRAFNLGVQHERERVSRLIELFEKGHLRNTELCVALLHLSLQVLKGIEEQPCPIEIPREGEGK
jgi:hypothetical protein